MGVTFCKAMLDDKYPGVFIYNLTKFIHEPIREKTYYFEHIKLMQWYARQLCRAQSFHDFIDKTKLDFIANAHDLFKEKYIKDQEIPDFRFEGILIPKYLNRYVRMNLKVLEPYGLDDYFNSDIGLHPLAITIFLIKELGVTDEELIYPIAFHSCPILPIYEKLDLNIKDMVDIIMLADKLSSNQINIHLKDKPVYVDLDRMVFGDNDNEVNYTLGLYVARLIGHATSNEEQSTQITEYYYHRLKELNPLIGKENNINNLGGLKIWPKRRFRLSQMQ